MADDTQIAEEPDLGSLRIPAIRSARKRHLGPVRRWVWLIPGAHLALILLRRRPFRPSVTSKG